MVKIQSRPYLCPAPNLVTVTGWELIAEGGESSSLQSTLPHWDPGTAIHVGITVQLDVAQIWESCRLASEDRLRLALLWESSSTGGTGLRGCGNSTAIHKNSSRNVIGLEVRIPGSQLADTVKFMVHLLLAQPGQSSFKLAPHYPGSILWKEEKTLQLEGSGTRFPTELLDFSKYLPSGAGWYLEWKEGDFEQSLMGSVRLFLNNENKIVAKSIQMRSREDNLVQSMIRYDVGKTMIISALTSESFRENYRTYEEGSVGATIRNMLYAYFPNDTIEGLAGEYASSPARFECALQERFRLFDEV